MRMKLLLTDRVYSAEPLPDEAICAFALPLRPSVAEVDLWPTKAAEQGRPPVQVVGTELSRWARRYGGYPDLAQLQICF